MNDLKWIACQGVNMNPYNLSASERLQNFGYALVFDEFGGGKTAKAQLCIHDVVSSEDKPSILIICPEALTQSWYSTLLSELGADFKLVSGLGDMVAFYSEHISNLYIISEEHLVSASDGFIGNASVVWDLMIIDAGFSADGVNWELYRNSCKNKARELLIFAPSPFPYNGDKTAVLKETVKGILYNDAQRELVDDLTIDQNIISFDRGTPVMRYYNTARGARNVITLEYEIDKNLTAPGRRVVDMQTGMPLYIHGGNVFEEYNLDKKHIYLRPYYGEDDIKALRETDTKLGVFLDKLSEILQKPGNNVVIYFASHITLKYVFKALSAVYPDMAGQIITQTGSAIDGAFLKRYFNGEDSADARVILATDFIGERYHSLKKATHIINYEYPETTAALERRYFRSGMESMSPEEFILFTDRHMMFDGRILCKVMASGLYKCFKVKIPSQNVLFWMPGVERYVTDMLLDLKFTVENAKGAGTDFAPRFRAEYNIVDFEQVSTALKASACAKQMLGGLAALFQISDVMSEGDVKRDDLLKAVKECVQVIRDGYIFYDDEMKPGLIKNENNLDAIARAYEGNKYVAGLKAAEEVLSALPANPKPEAAGYPYIRDAVESLPDGLKAPVLYNVWKYFRVKKGVKKPLREFIGMYNKGVI
ncbi:MAG: DEAD/DEAH box helicase family protein [Oscillospiraceae bacterium]|jgi:hypothetical protein|nr:DEAD/DEAH box helicase family protein [Oscillospiraceae bacterium]